MTDGKSILALLVVGSVVACAPSGPTQSPPPTATVCADQGPAAEVVREFVAAFNAHDVDAMLALAHDEVEWISIKGSSAAPETKGKAELRAGMEGYFGSIPSAHSDIVGLVAGSRFVAVRERAQWNTEEGTRSQTAIAVYEIVDGLVRRVSYFPAEPEP